MQPAESEWTLRYSGEKSMNTQTANEAEAYAEQVHEEELDLLRTLGVIPAPSHHEDERAAFIRNWMEQQGFPCVHIDQAKNVISAYGCEGKEDLIIYAAHMDVVFPDTSALPMKEDRERIYAPGIGDDTANLVNLLLAARYVIRHEIHFPFGILFVANACEEGLGNLDGTKALFAEYGTRVRAFYSFDGYLAQCTSSAVGSCRYRISCRTIGGHSYENFGNPNAIELLARMIEKLYAVPLPTKAKTTFNVGRIEGGTTVNSIAESASMLYEFRSPMQSCLDQMAASLEQVVSSMENQGGTIDVELLGVRPGNGPIDADKLEAFTSHSADIIRRWYDKDLNFSPYSTDSNIPLSLGIPANTIGTVYGEHPHTREEWIDKKSLLTGMKIALCLMLDCENAFN